MKIKLNFQIDIAIIKIKKQEIEWQRFKKHQRMEFISKSKEVFLITLDGITTFGIAATKNKLC